MIARAARTRRTLAPVLALTLAFTALTALAADPAEAAVDRPFAPVFTSNTNGSILLRGNSSMTCPTTASTCAAARNAAVTEASGNNNNAFSMVYVDIDNVAATVNSSSATVTLPAGANVLFAGLYWAGDEKGATTLDRTKVKFATPRTAAGTYNNITASETTTSTANSGNATPYQSFADVTSLVKAGGSGTYTVADIRAATGTDKFAGWSLVLAINDPAAPMRNLTVFDGFGVVQQSDPTVTIPVTGFQTPPAGTVRTQVGAVVYEGDFGLTGDTLQLNGTSLTNARNPSTNVFNSTVTEEGVVVPGRTPGDANVFSVDIDRFQADGLIPNGATSASLRLNTTSETFYPGVVTFATDLYSPKLDITKTVVDVNGGTTEPGDVLQYTLDLKNNGQDSATLTRLLDAIPTNTSYVAGSLTLDGRALTDAVDADVGSLETAQGRVRVNLGTGATAAAGGTVAVGATAKVTFRVKIDAGLTGDVDIVNVAAADYTGAQTGLGISSVSNATGTAVVAPRADLRITKTSNPTTVQRGQPVTYTLTVINDGPKPAQGVVVTDTLPSGVVPTATSSQGTCSVSGSVVTCAVGDMAVGATVTITVGVAGTGNAPDPLLDTATVRASTIDPDGSDDTGTASTVVNRAPAAANDSAETDTDKAVTVAVLGNDTDPDGNPLTVTGATITGTPNGTVTIGADGRLTYTPNKGYAGPETISYSISDGRGGTAGATVTITVRNAGPSAVNDATSTAPNTQVKIPVLTNDTDPNIPGTAQTLSITGVSTPAQGGSATLEGNQVVYAPAAGFKGTDTFTYTISDGAGGTATATVSVTVPNAAPVAVDDAVTTPHATAVPVTVLANDTDNNGDPLTVDAFTQPAAGTGAVTREGNRLVYTPPTGFRGVATFTYTVTDPSGGTATATVRVTVLNAGPKATDDNAGTDTNAERVIEVLGNDTDANNDALTITGTSTPAHGSLAVAGNGRTVTYTPAPGYRGTDSFTYTISDGNGGTSTATVNLTVRNADPKAVNDVRSTAAGQPVTVAVLTNDTDANNDPLTLTNFQATGDQGGTITRTGDSLVYTPAKNFLGVESFTYTVSDGAGGTATGTVRVTVVNTEPVANDDAVTVVAARNGSITLDVLANDTDANADKLTISDWTTGQATSVALIDGKLVYTYPNDFAGVDQITYTVTDGKGGIDTAVVTVTITNPAPTPVDDAASTARNVAVLIDAAANDTDPNGDPVRVLKVAPPASGAVVEIVAGKVRYTPAPGFQGADTVTYTVVDARGAIGTALITVQVSNAPPKAVNDAITTDLDASVTVDVRANDTDPESDPLTVTGTTSPANGTVRIDEAGTLTYTPRPGYAGPDSFTYTIADGRGGTATATVTVTVRNAAPVAAPDERAAAPDATVNVDALDNDTDPNIPATAQKLTIVAVTQPANGTARILPGGQFVEVKPATGFRGTLTLNYTIADGAGGTAGSTISVQVANAGPVAAPDRETTPYLQPVLVPVTANDVDPNGDVLRVVEVGDPKDADGTRRGLVTIVDGGVRYQPPTGFSGEITFSYTVTDEQGAEATSVATVVIGNATPAPRADSAETLRREPVTINVLDNDVDPNGDDLTVVGILGVDPRAGSAVVDDDGRVVFTAAPDFVGTTTFTYQVTDRNGGLASTTVTVVVRNDDPAASDDSAQTTLGTSVVVPVLANDGDPDADALVVSSVTEPAHGGAVALPDGTVRYTPAAGWAGTDTFTYLVRDPYGATAQATVTVVTLNAAPDARDDQAGAKPDQRVTIPVLANDVDPNVGFTAQKLSVVAVAQPAVGGTVEIVEDGTQIRFTPTPGFAGQVTFNYTIRDGASGDAGGAGEDTATVSILVDNATPAAGDDALGTPFQTGVTIAVRGNDSDPNNDPLTITAVTVPRDAEGRKRGTATVVDGTIRYEPPDGFTGAVTFSYTISDGKGGSDDATVTVEVGNGPPRAVEDAATTKRDVAVEVPVLSNDSDANGDPLRIVSATGGAAGSVLLVDNVAGVDVLRYTPAPGFAGVDVVEYTVADGRGGESTATVRITVPNAAPVFAAVPANAGQVVDVGSPLAPLKVSDPDGDRLTVGLAGNTLPPGVSLNSDGTFTGTPTSRGDYPFTVEACDDRAPPACTRLTLTISVRNQMPMIAPDTAITDTDTFVDIDVLTNDADADGDGLVVVGTSEPAHGSVLVVPGGLIRYTPARGYAGPDTFTYTVDDGNGGTATATVAVTVRNAAPAAVDDVDGTGPGQSVVVPVLANDTDANVPGSADQKLTVSAVTQPAAGGTVSISDGGTTVTVAPAAGFRGDLTFDYTITDGRGGTDTATVRVTVSNAAPVITPDSAETPYLTQIDVPVLATDSDPNGDVLTIRQVGTPVDSAGRPTGTVEIIGGAVRYTPPERFSGTVTFPYTAGDDRDSGTATVTVVVLDAPPVAGPDSGTTDRRTALDLDVLDNDSDPNRDPLTIVGIAGVDPEAGSVRLDDRGTADPRDDVLVFTPKLSFAGTTTFSYQISDGRGELATAVVTVTVENTAPTAEDDRETTSTDVAVRIDRGANDTDPDDDPLTVVDVTTPLHGSVTIGPDNSLTYHPAPGWAGGDKFDYTVSDGRGGFDTATVIVITANADPVANPDKGGTGPDETTTIAVLADDTDPNIPGTDQQLKVDSVTQPAGGTVRIVSDGTAVEFDPEPEFQGEVTFEYTIVDGAGGSATATVTVLVSGARPAAVDDVFTTPYFTAVPLTPLANDTDPNGDALSVADLVPPTTGTLTTDAQGRPVYNPPAGFSGTVSFGYTVRDATGLIANATITVVVGNGMPRAANDSVTGTRDAAIPVDVRANDSDPNGEPLRIVGTDGGAAGSVGTVDDRGTTDPADDVVRYLPAPGFAGTDTFTYTVRDTFGDEATATVTVTISNAAPVFADEPRNRTQTVEVDQPLLPLRVTDPDGDPVSITVVSGALPPGVSLLGDGSFAGNPSGRGTFVLTVAACDDRSPRASTEQTVTIVVRNQLPRAEDDVAITGTDAAVEFPVLANDSDLDGDELTVVATGEPGHGSVTILPGGNLKYTPAAGYAGPDVFTYTVDDGNGGTATATVRVTVNNAAPDAVDDAAGTAPNTAVTVAVLTNDTDPNLPGSANQKLTITAVTQPTAGATVAIDAGAESVTVTPTAAFRGDLTFTYTISDGKGGADTATVRVTVSNATPVILPDDATTPYLEPATIDVLANDVDPNDDPLTIRSVGTPVDSAGEERGRVEIVDGRLVYTPPSGFSGTVTFPYSAGDDTADRSATVTVTVRNAAPTADPETARTDRNTAVPIEVLDGDTDPNRDALTIIGVHDVDPAAGSVVLDDRGTDDPADDILVFTPNRAFAGETTFRYEISDGQGGRSSALVTVTVLNTGPRAEDAEASTGTDTPVRINRGANDSDVDGDPLTVVDLTAPTHGSVTIDPDGALVYAPATGWAGDDEFAYTVSDGRGGTATATVVVRTANANPVPDDDDAGTGPDAAVTIPVLEGDTDLNIPGTDQQLRVVEVPRTSIGGTVDIVDGGRAVKFTPQDGFQGTFTFDYVVTDGAGGTATGKVTVIVDGAAPGPVDDFYTTTYLKPVELTPLGNDRDPNGDALTVASVAPPAVGTVTTEQGRLVYQPAAGFSGSVTFGYTVRDATGLTADATITVVVGNGAPTAGNDSATGSRDTTIPIDFRPNDADPNGQALTIVGTAGGAPGSVVTVDDRGTPDPADDVLSYTPPPGFAGTDSFTYTVRDPAGDEATATVTVTIANGAPVFAAVPGNSRQTLDVGASLLPLQVSDPDGDPVTVSLVSGELPPGVALNTDGTFTGEPTARGPYPVTLRACDDRRPTACTEQTLTIVVLNQVPRAGDDTAATGTNGDVDIRVLANDSDRDGDALTVVTTGEPAHGAVVILPDGQLRYTPAAGYAGPDAFTYTVDDGNGGTVTATVRVTVANARPDALDDVTGTGPNTPVVVQVLTNDVDANIPGSPDQALRITAATQPAKGGTVAIAGDGRTVTVTPTAAFRGDLTFTYTISDGKGGEDTATVTVTVSNAEPVILPDERTTPYREPVTVNVLGNDVDPNDDPLTIADVGDPVDANGDRQGGVEVVDGKIVYTPPTGFSGTVTFPYTAGDGTASGTATVTITVLNAPPVADAETARTDRNTPVRIDVLSGDDDPNGDVLTIVGISGVDPDAGSVVLDTRGTDDPRDDVLVFTPNRAFAGETSFRYEIADGQGGRVSALVTVTVVNTPPTAGNDEASTGTDQAVRIDRAANDSDPDTDDLRVADTTTPRHGTVVVDADGALVYRPAPGWAGEDAFDYTISDGRGGTATATVRVTTENADPVADADAAGTAPDTAVTVLVLEGDTDPNLSGTDQELRVTQVTQAAVGGTVEIVGGGTAVRYTPDDGFQGRATFTYTVSDGAGGTATATVTVTVDGAAPAVVDDFATTGYLQPVVLTPLANDADPNDDELTVASVAAPAKGAVTQNAQGQYVYTPPAGFSGTVSFPYTVRDATGLTATATITVVVGNGAPSAENDLATGTRDAALPIDVRANDSDPNGDALSIVSAEGGAPGSVVAVDDRGTPADPSDDVVVYTPAPGFAGTDTFTYVVRDPSGAEAGATVTVTVPNKAPLFTDAPANTTQSVDVGRQPAPLQALDPDRDEVSFAVVGGTLPPGLQLTDEGTFAGAPITRGEYTFTVQACDDRAPRACSEQVVSVVVRNQPPGVADDADATDTDVAVTIAALANDGDLDGDPLTVVSTSAPAYGAVTIGADGALTYSPNPGYAGPDAFTYTVDDGHGGQATATVRITVRNAAPLAVADEAGTGPGRQVRVPVLANDTDANVPGSPAQSTRVVAVEQPAAGGTVRIADDRQSVVVEPSDGFRGEIVFTYTVGDGAGGRSSATVTVTVSNAAPVIVDDAAVTAYLAPVTVNVLGNDTDPNNDKLTIRQVGAPVDPSGAVTGTVQVVGGQLVYSPPAGFSGVVTFPYTAGDDRDSSPATVTVSVGNAPPAAKPDSATTDRNTAVSIPVLSNDTDANGDILTVVGFGSVDPAEGSVAIGADGAVVFTPNRAFTGDATFYYVIDDGRGGRSSATVTVTVENRGPGAGNDEAATTTGQSVRIDRGANDVDPDGDPLLVGPIGAPDHGSVTVNPDGSLEYHPAAGWAGEDKFTYTVSDPGGATATATVTVVTANADPSADADSAGTGPGKTVTIPVLEGDTDPNIPGTGQKLTVSAVTQPLAGGTVRIVNDGTAVEFEPADGFQGQVTFRYEISDGAGGVAESVVTVTVDGAAPGAVDDFYPTAYGAGVVLTPLANDTDPNDDALTVVTVDKPATGTVTTDSEGRLVYTPADGFSGTVSFDYTVRDGTGLVARATITVVVGNAGPTAQNDSATAPRDTATPINVRGNDSDPNGEPLTIVGTSGGAAGSSVTVDDGGTPDDPRDDVVVYTPPAGFAGTDTFTYTVRDPAGAEATATVTITVPNAAPSFTDSVLNTLQEVGVGNTLTPLVVADPDRDRVTFSIVEGSGTLPPGVTLNPDGTFTGAPTVPGSFPVTVRVCDDRVPAACTDQQLTITVTPVQPTVEPDRDPPSDPAPTPAPTPVPPAAGGGLPPPASEVDSGRGEPDEDDGVVEIIEDLAHTGAENVMTLLAIGLALLLAGAALRLGVRIPGGPRIGRHRRH